MSKYSDDKWDRDSCSQRNYSPAEKPDSEQVLTGRCDDHCSRRNIESQQGDQRHSPDVRRDVPEGVIFLGELFGWIFELMNDTEGLHGTDCFK